MRVGSTTASGAWTCRSSQAATALAIQPSDEQPSSTHGRPRLPPDRFGPVFHDHHPGRKQPM
ncbi:MULTISPECIES: hypothetical protein [unclassified Streptomyces]|uniref:hypothetical protein n=1 Tax=unclassified Streptomyces TaxID=2593676 RepID=UPI00234B8EE0|nr:hypothetical protein [Streptomyces sp. M92]WCN05218.1 hypothetical protein M6G08_25660 [Streptomyces sp. M92]